MSEKDPHIFAGYGIELEYMIVGRESLDVLPVADRVLERAAGRMVNEVEYGPIGWSNELVLHVIELKTVGPVAGLAGLEELFQENVGRANDLLAELDGRLMPGGMHPWMDPHRETNLWPHGDRAIYRAYDRIFGCRGHGWANLQSMHLNLGFRGDEEFAALHSAIRLLLPLLPALAASSPVAEGEVTGLMDTRLDYYRRNQLKVPSITGAIIPENAGSRREYREKILARLYADIRPHDPDHLLQYEWLNSRGAIARFERSAIEIRLADVQECPAADLAVAGAIIGGLRWLVERQAGGSPGPGPDEMALREILLATIREGEQAAITDRGYLEFFGTGRPLLTAGELWQLILEKSPPDSRPASPAVGRALDLILAKGPLARRLLKAIGPAPSRCGLADVYRQLCDCLAGGEPFDP